ncbi:MarR family transcriptional regulator [Rhodococcus sp. 06-462-5]|uniref:MarR family winged helix-turn-helix transcriptional regulator n=1 Tax=unclassified Rhodococcus (in: high G+C Gram-positive bacteria) TaxID=192944 RepID=UPI000B9C6D4D|nr:MULTISPECIES: MarR family transcriptional regulator [unclassified Rhodococcus (in: high G+C Gram-positive bacteria)]OZC71411.1 MarR family transcriptional regulator [Rhodococcus sp. 06-462-5]OZE70585.1 MarR family transcriptional regulator [Rhodococcus sp. 02-925g]
MTDASLRELTCARWAEFDPELDTSPMQVVAQIKRIVALLELAVEPIYDAADVTVAEMELMVPLRHAVEPATAVRLAELLGMTRAGVSKALGKLERRGFLERVQNAEDRRSASITLTDAGKDVVDEVFPRELAAHGRLFDALGARRMQVLEALDVLAESMDDAVSSQ